MENEKVYTVYWIKDGKEREGETRELGKWLEWARKNTTAYGYDEKE